MEPVRNSQEVRFSISRIQYEEKKNNELVTLIIYVFLELQSSNLYNKNQSNKEKKKSLTFGLGRRTGRIRAAMSPVLLAALGILLDPTKSTSCLILIPEFKGINTLASRYKLSIFTPYLSVVVKTTDCSIVKVNPRVMLLFFFVGINEKKQFFSKI